MVGDLDTAYLAGLPVDQRAGLEWVNAPGLVALRSYLESGEAVAFLGAGARRRCIRCGTGSLVSWWMRPRADCPLRR